MGGSHLSLVAEPRPPLCPQEELVSLRAEHQQDAEDLFRKIVRASQVGLGTPTAD